MTKNVLGRLITALCLLTSPGFAQEVKEKLPLFTYMAHFDISRAPLGRDGEARHRDFQDPRQHNDEREATRLRTKL